MASAGQILEDCCAINWRFGLDEWYLIIITCYKTRSEVFKFSPQFRLTEIDTGVGFVLDIVKAAIVLPCNTMAATRTGELSDELWKPFRIAPLLGEILWWVRRLNQASPNMLESHLILRSAIAMHWRNNNAKSWVLVVVSCAGGLGFVS
jgi:hypothetical protein